MTPARKTTAILALAGAVAVGAALFHRGAPAHAPTPAPPESAGELDLRARLASSHVLAGEHEAHMAVTVRGPAGERAERPPLNLAIVLDRSGSMAGGKLEDAKAAALELVGQLRPDDRFAVIAYGTEVERVMPSTSVGPEARRRASAAIEGIYDDGSTNLSGGLTAAREEIEAFTDGDRVSRIVLISDGIANEGIVAPERLAQLARRTANRSMSITTVGVGLDFDERTMTRLAVEGRGRYHFVEDTAMLAELFAGELDSLGETTAVDVTLALEPAPGVEILEAYGHRPVHEGGRVSIPISDLHAGELRKVVLRVRVDAPRSGAVDVADVEVSYRRTGQSGRKRARVTARAEVTRERRVVEDNRDADATRHIERALTARAIEEATTLSEKGDHEAARGVLDDRADEARSTAADLGDDSLAAELQQVTDGAQRNLKSAASAPAGGKTGKRAVKDNRADAYDLVR